MKKLLYSGLMALMMLFAMPSIVRADEGEGVTVALSPAGGEVNDGTRVEITVSLPTGYLADQTQINFVVGSDSLSLTTMYTELIDNEYSEDRKPVISGEDTVLRVRVMAYDADAQMTTINIYAKYSIAKGDLANPSIRVNGGIIMKHNITVSDEISILAGTEGDDIEVWYTTNGGTPAKDGENSIKYTEKFTLNEGTVTVKAIAVNTTDNKTSAVVEAYFKVTEAVEAQVMLVDGNMSPVTTYGKYVDFMAALMVDGEPQFGASIFYTTDGTTVPSGEAYREQDDEGPIYMAEQSEDMPASLIMLTADQTTLKVVGMWMAGTEWNETSVQTFELSALPLVNPILDVESGTAVKAGDSVKITNADQFSSIFYSIDGKTIPTYAKASDYTVKNVFKYENGIKITEGVTIKVIGYNEVREAQSTVPVVSGSDLVTATYTIKAADPEPVEEKVASVTFNPAGGAVVANATVTITTTTPEATVYYRKGDNGEFSQYASPVAITEACTLYAFAKKEGMTNSDTLPATYTIKTEEPTVTITLDPADGATVQKGSSITITVDGEYEEIDYKWFATKTEAQTAVESFNSTSTGWSWDENPIVGEDLALAVVVIDGNMKVLASAVAEYTIGGSTEPGVTITFNPADGAEVEEGDTIRLTATDASVKIVYRMFPNKDIAALNGWAWTEDGEQVGFIYGETGYPVISNTMKGIKVGYIKGNNTEPESTFVNAGYTVKAQSTKLDVDIEFMTDAYGQARFAKKSDKIRLVLEDYEGIELYYAIVTDEDEQPSYVQYGEGLIGLSELEGNFTVKAYAVKGIQRSDVFSAEYVLLDIIEPTLEFDATAAKNYPMEFNVKSVSYPDIMDKDMMVYYTLDGETEPSDTAFLNQEGDVIKYLQKQEGIWQNYLEPTENITVWAKAYVMLDEGANLVMETPAVKKAVEMNVLSNPVITPAVAATEYNAGDTVKVAIEVPEDADVLFYTLDGSEPLFSRTIGNEDLIDSVIFAYYPSWGEPFDTIVVTKSTTVKAIAYKEPAFRMGYVPGAGSDVVSATFGFKVELTFNPESGSEVYEGTRVAITSEDETIDIFYMMFESEEAAKAAEWNQEEAELYGEMQPVVTKSSNTVKVAYARRGATEVTENFFYATYTVKELPAVTLTLNPATGSEVEENTKVTVTPSRELVEGEAIVFRMFANKTAADTCADDVMINEGMIYGEPDEDDDQIGYPVITQEAPVLKIGVLGAMDEEGNWIYNWIVAEYKIKGQVSANEAGELAGVSIYPNPTEGEFNVVAPVNAEVEIFNATGVVVKRVNVSAGANAMRLENSGIYFVRVRANGQMAVKKVVIR